MIHIRDSQDGAETNDRRRFLCGIVGKLPEGDIYWFDHEYNARRADCSGCNPGGPQPIGTPLSELSGRPGQPGYEKFRAIAASYGYE